MSTMTQEEATTKWCPFSRAIEADPTGRCIVQVNRVRGIDPARSVLTSCIASHCMAWRWMPEEGIAARRGFCGLAGAPRL